MAIQSTSFHPMRFARTRPYLKQFVAYYLERFGRRRTSLADPEVLSPLIAEAYARTLRRLGPVHAAAPMLQRAQELDIAATFARFTAHGRNVFSLTPTLMELLAGTRLDGLQLQDLALPYDCFYIGFGEPLRVGLPGEPNRIDGAYIEATDEGLLIRITSRRLDVPPRARGSWVSHPEPTYIVYLRGEPDESVPALLEQSIEAVADATFRWGIDAFHDDDFPDHSEDPIASAWDAMMVLDEAKPVAEHVLAITLNALCYLASIPGEEDRRSSLPILPADAPDHLARATHSGRPSHRAAAAVRLSEGGYLPVRILGGSIRPLVRQTEESSGRSVSPHWRRGHPRRQNFGPGLQQHRVIRIPPTLVRADLGEALHGHVYAVR